MEHFILSFETIILIVIDQYKPRQAVIMNSPREKENMPVGEHGSFAELRGVSARTADKQSRERRASIDSIKSLDVSNNIPRILSPMDAEDSPWGGMSKFE